jgi:putative ABC transport system permease protein
MSLNLRPLLSSLWRSPTGALLVTLQVAITLAVLVNAAWLVRERIAQIERPTGINTRDTFGMMVGGLSRKFGVAKAENEDLAYLRSVPGVRSATLADGIPLTGIGTWYSQYWRRPGQHGTSVWADVQQGDGQALLGTLEVPLVAGRNFRPDEVQPLSSGKQNPPPAEIILTQSLAQALFAHGSALGRTIYDADGNPLTIIGITRDYMGAVNVGSGMPVYYTALVPIQPGQPGFYALLVRTQPGRRDQIMRAAERHIGAAHRYGAIAITKTLAAARDGFESNDRNIAILLTSVTALMLIVCCLGIFGLATFNVGSRTRQIGTRRAVGARRGDIVAHFLLENALILTAGALLGSVSALAVGGWLTHRYGLPRLDIMYLLAGVGVLGTIGQLAAWQPARRAAAVPPSVATRTV